MQTRSLDTVRFSTRVMVVWWFVLVAATAIILVEPEFHLAFYGEAVSFTLMTLTILSASLVSLAAAARFIFDRRSLDLAIAVAFGVLGATALWFGLILPFAGYMIRDLGDAPIYGWTLSRLFAGALLLIGLLDRRGPRWNLSDRYRWVVAAGGVVIIINVALWHWRTVLPQLLNDRAWQTLEQLGQNGMTGILPGQSVVAISLDAGLAFLYAVVALLLIRHLTRGSEVWLGLALVTAAMAEAQFVYYPDPFIRS